LKFALTNREEIPVKKPKSMLTNRPTLKWTFLLIMALQFNPGALAGYNSADDSSSSTSISSMLNFTPRLASGSVIALNRDLTLKDRFLPQGSELVIDEDGSLSLIGTNTTGEALEELVEIGANVNELNASEYTILDQDEETGEITAYNLPDDFKVAGRGRVRAKRGGVTKCYHVVKQIVRRRITLTGGSAYMAAPQLAAAGWRRYSDYASAPSGSVCVFSPGGVRTTSGGHIHGHVGVKGAGGIANPTSGFHLQRPFLGCWNEK
jgi:hypothetical protein